MNSLIYTPSSLFLSFPSLFFLPPKCNDRIDLIGETWELHIHHKQNGMESSKAYWRFLFFLVCLITSCKSFHTFVCLSPSYHLPSSCMYDFIDWIGRLFFVFYWFGSVRFGFILSMFCVCLACLFYCSYATSIYEHTSIHILDLASVVLYITLFLYHSSILDRVSSQKDIKLNRQLTANKQHQDIHTKGQTTNKWQVTKKCCVWYDNNSKIGSDRFNSNKSNSKPNPIHNPPFTHSLFEFLFLFFCPFSIILSAS